MNWRALGCGVIAAAIFVGIGLLGMSLAFSRFDGCPALLQWGERSYEPGGPTRVAPSFDQLGDPVQLGSTFLGLGTRALFGPAGSRPSAKGTDRPEQIALDCGDGSFQTYNLARVLAPSGTPASPSPR